MSNYYITKLKKNQIEDALKQASDVYQARWNVNKKWFYFRKKFQHIGDFLSINVRMKCIISEKDLETIVEIVWLFSMSLLDVLIYSALTFTIVFYTGTKIGLNLDCIIIAGGIGSVLGILILEIGTKINRKGIDIYENNVMALKRILKLEEISEE